MQKGLEVLGIEHYQFSCRPTLNIDKVVSYAPDLIVYGLKDMLQHKDWRRELRTRLPKAKIILWYGDFRDDKTGQEKGKFDELDMMFVSNNAQDEFYKKWWGVECHFMPLGSMIYTPEYKPKFDFPMVFIGATTTGAWMADRSVQISKLVEHGLKVINARADKQPKLRAEIMKEMPNIYHSSRLSLDISHFTDIKGYTSNRFWNITASNGLALTKRFPQCEEFYPEGTRIYFDTIEEAIEKKNYYLEHQKEADDIRAAGYEHAKNHTYEHRWKAIFDYLY